MTIDAATEEYFDRLDEALTAGDVEVLEVETGLTGTQTLEDLKVFATRGRPALGQAHATGQGRSARRQVRLPAHLNERLDAYTRAHNTNPSEVIRAALETYLSDPAAA